MRRRIAIILIVSILFSCFPMHSVAAANNLGFESDLSGWTHLNGTIIDTSTTEHTYSMAGNTWTIQANGNKMLKIVPAGSNSTIETIGNILGLSADSKSYFSTNFPNPTNFGYIYQDVSLTAGETYDLYWNFVGTDNASYNDASVLTFVNLDDASKMGHLDGDFSEIRILGAITPGTGEYSTGSYKSTGWIKSEFKAVSSGNYRLGIAVFNLGDAAVAPLFFLDDGAGTLKLNGVTYDPIEKDPNAPKPASKKITYSAKTFNESSNDDGTIDTTATLTLENDTFTGTNDTNMTDVSFNNVPAGLSAVITKKTDTTAELKFTGSATTHLDINDVSNVSVAFSDAAFSGGNASIVSNANVSDIAIDFISTASSDANLVSLSTSAGTLTPSFSSDTTSYSVSVGNTVGSVKVTPTATSGAAITVNNIVVSSGSESQDISLNVGSNAIAVEVTAEDNVTKKSYSIDVERAGSSNANLADLTISSGVLTPSFDSSTTSYIVNVANQITAVTLTPTVTSGAAITVNGEQVSSGSQSQELSLTVGSNAVSIVVVAQDNIATKSYSVVINRAEVPRSNSSSNKNTVVTDPAGVEVVINGKTRNVGTSKVSSVNGVRTVSISVDKKSVEKRIEEAVASNSSKNVIEFPIRSNDQTRSEILLTGDIVKKLEKDTFDISVQSNGVNYVVPASEFEISKVAEKLNVAEESMEEIVVSVEINKLSREAIDHISASDMYANKNISMDPIEFKIMATVKRSNNESEDVEIEQFEKFVTRSINVPGQNDAQKITTGVVVNPDGTLSHVPTKVYKEQFKWFADFNSLTNSIYSAIYNPVKAETFKGHWSERSTNDLASRLIVENYDQIQPEDAITRGDFITYLVKGLGLYRTEVGTLGLFKDVPLNDPYSDALTIASTYGLANGYDDRSFKPHDPITREEAMVIFDKALKFVSPGESLIEGQTAYLDQDDISRWAKQSVAHVSKYDIFLGRNSRVFSPKSNLTYAEAIVSIRKYLVESELIND